MATKQSIETVAKARKKHPELVAFLETKLSPKQGDNALSALFTNASINAQIMRLSMDDPQNFESLYDEPSDLGASKAPRISMDTPFQHVELIYHGRN